MLNRARALLEKRGYEVKGLAPSASAVKTLATEAGIESETLQRFLARNDRSGRGTADQEGREGDASSLPEDGIGGGRGAPSPPRSRPGTSFESPTPCGFRAWCLWEMQNSSTRWMRESPSPSCSRPA